LSPSSAHRWRKCSDAPNQEAGLPNESTVYAAEGTVFHEYAALCLEIGIDPYVFVGAPMEVEDHGVLLFDREMADNMLYGLDYLRDCAAVPGSKLFVETRVDLTPWLGHDWSPDLTELEDEDGEYGTTDAGIVNVSEKWMIVYDWKYGKGIPVSPFWNDQLILYGLGLWNTVAEVLFAGVNPAEIEVTLVIEQPRALGGGGTWTTTMAVLLAEGHRITIDAEATKEVDAKCTPGAKQCRMCRAAKFNTCKAHAEHIVDLFDLKLNEISEFADIGGKPPLLKPSALTPEQRSYILEHKAMFTRWLETLHSEAYEDAMQGRPTPGLKLVSGRSPPRKWKDEDKTKPTLVRNFGEAAWTKKLLSPTQVEEKVGKPTYNERFKRHVLYGEPRPELVPITDKRPALTPVGDRFDTLMKEPSS
jgi:hypothetical protein